MDKKSDDGGMDHSGVMEKSQPLTVVASLPRCLGQSADLRRIWEADLLGIFGGCEW